MKSILAIMQHRTSARIIEDDDAPIRPFPNVYAFPSERYSFPWRRLLWPSPQNGSYLVSMSLIFILLYLQKKSHLRFPHTYPDNNSSLIAVVRSLSVPDSVQSAHYHTDHVQQRNQHRI